MATPKSGQPGGTPRKGKQTAEERRRTVEAMRAEQKASERRKTMLIVGGASVAALGLVAVAAVPAYLDYRDDPVRQSITSFGVPKADAGCGEVDTTTATGSGEHKDGVLTYPTSPPSFGAHDGQFITDPRNFYTPDDRPPVEKLVHSLEHGYTVVWYDDTITGARLDALEGLSQRMPEEDNVQRWFIAAPWTAADAESRKPFPEGKHIAMTHWGKTDGHLQYCADVSGEAVQEFTNNFPRTDAPEAGAV